MMIGYHPTLKVPPISTIYGFLSSAKGSSVNPENSTIGYVLESETNFVDLETIYQIEGSGFKAKSNIMKREQLYNINLWLYVDKNTSKYLDYPHFPLFLGRSSDLVYLFDKKEVNLTENIDTKIGKSCLPFLPQNSNRAIIQALPTYITDEIPRKPMFFKNYFFIDDFVQTSSEERNKILFDEEKGWGIYIYDKSIFN
jgi:CRISPR-associated protein Cas5t